MTLEQFMKLDQNDFYKMSDKELKQIVSSIGKTLNKRISRLSSSSSVSQDSVRFINETGGKFGVRGKDKEELIDEAIREQKFNNSPTSRFNKARQVKQERERATDKARKTEQAKAQGKSTKEIAKIKGKTQEERLKDYMKKGVKMGKFKLNSKAYKKEKAQQKKFIQYEDEGLWDAFHKYRERHFQVPYDSRKDVVAVFSKIEKKYDLKAVANDDELFAKAFEDELKYAMGFYEGDEREEKYKQRDKKAQFHPIGNLVEFNLDDEE